MLQSIAALTVIALLAFWLYRKAENERRQVQARERLLRDRGRLIAELERKNAELERINYTISHDLKSPLVTIKGFLGLLREDTASGDTARIAQDIDRIGKAADRMSVLLEELLELARVDHRASYSQKVALTEVAAEAKNTLTGRLAKRAVEIAIAPDLPLVIGNRLRLSEVMQNLLENAIKYMGEQRAPKIEVGVRHDGGRQVVTVRDNGLGIDPKYHRQVFELFERLDASVEGTGVGLTLTKRIVERHGGTIWVESQGCGQGSTFCFTCNEAAAAGDAAPDAEPLPEAPAALRHRLDGTVPPPIV